MRRIGMPINVGQADPADDMREKKLLTALKHERHKPGGRGRYAYRGGRLSSADRKAIRAHRAANGT